MKLTRCHQRWRPAPNEPAVQMAGCADEPIFRVDVQPP